MSNYRAHERARSSLTVTFEYELPAGDMLLVEAEITPGRPEHINCLPEDAYPEEYTEAEIVSCNHWKDGKIGDDYPFYGVFRIKYRTAKQRLEGKPPTYICIETELAELAIDEWVRQNDD